MRITILALARQAIYCTCVMVRLVVINVLACVPHKALKIRASGVIVCDLEIAVPLNNSTKCVQHQLSKKSWNVTTCKEEEEVVQLIKLLTAHSRIRGTPSASKKRIKKTPAILSHRTPET
ncbi:hypothetical protein CC80DRAFT_226972 [Byssothecium circinans]|uniref:Uncharacterized protein n=1 Tax=Byssothecium circinans TaxID=147558 RepID=A0A6A5TNY1_9PLEO|nr:hypothetical protein CC80DRAFT_226972 [Byssothecium circinans]